MQHREARQSSRQPKDQLVWHSIAGLGGIWRGMGLLWRQLSYLAFTLTLGQASCLQPTLESSSWWVLFSSFGLSC